MEIQIGKKYRVTQATFEKGEIGKAIQFIHKSLDGDNYYKFEGLEHQYTSSQVELVVEAGVESETIHNQILKLLNLDEGDEVKVIAKVPSSHLGWMNSWLDEMDKSVGKKFIVHSVGKDNGVLLGNRWFPAQCIEVVKRKPKCVKFILNNSYTAIISEDGSVQVGCQTFDATTMKNFIDCYNKTISN